MPRKMLSICAMLAAGVLAGPLVAADAEPEKKSIEPGTFSEAKEILRKLRQEKSEAEEAPARNDIESPTHKQTRTITFAVGGKRATLHSFKTTPAGHIAAVVSAGDRHQIQLLDAAGEVIKAADLPGQATGVAVAPDGTLYVGADGKILAMDADLSVTATADSPHVGDVEELRQAVIEAAKSTQKSSTAIYERQLATMTKAIEKLEAKEEPTKIDAARLKMYRKQATVFEDLIAKAGEEPEVDESKFEYAIERAKAVISMAAGEDHVFLCAYDKGSRTKNVWRIDRDLSADSVKEVFSSVRGCCGQFDIQCCPTGLVVSENTAFRVGLYDFDGNEQGEFGGRDRSSKAGFGSCCNPMNSLPMADGSILTAESSIGHIKRFDTDGNLLAYVGKAKIGGGCKHCAMGHIAGGDVYLMMAEDDNAICVLEPMPESERKAATTAVSVSADAEAKSCPADCKGCGDCKSACESGAKCVTDGGCEDDAEASAAGVVTASR